MVNNRHRRMTDQWSKICPRHTLVLALGSWINGVDQRIQLVSSRSNLVRSFETNGHDLKRQQSNRNHPSTMYGPDPIPPKWHPSFNLGHWLTDQWPGPTQTPAFALGFGRNLGGGPAARTAREDMDTTSIQWLPPDLWSFGSAFVTEEKMLQALRIGTAADALGPIRHWLLRQERAEMAELRAPQAMTADDTRKRLKKRLVLVAHTPASSRRGWEKMGRAGCDFGR
jgi:hypothetical protein